MKKQAIVMAAMLAATVSFGADELTDERVFNITNYPAVLAAHDAYNAMEKTDGYSMNKIFWATQTEEQKDAYLADILRIAQDWGQAGIDSVWYAPQFDLPHLIDDGKVKALDVQLAAAGCKRGVGILWNVSRDVCASYYILPNVYDAWWNSINVNELAKEKVRVDYTVYHRYQKFGDIPFEAKINMYANYIATLEWTAGATEIKSLINLLPTYLKRKLREQGKTFFVNEETGDNPVQDATNEFIAAFNAPRLAGLKELVAKWNPDYEWIEIPNLWLTDEQVNELKEKVYYGEVDLTGVTKRKLMANLGLDAYNEFVDWYNGGSKQ